MEFSLVCNTTKTTLIQEKGKAKENYPVLFTVLTNSIIHHGYLFSLCIKHVKQSQTLTLCPFLRYTSTHNIRQMTENTCSWEKLQAGSKIHV